MIQSAETILQQKRLFAISSLERIDDIDSLLNDKQYASNYRILWIREGSGLCTLDLCTIPVKNSQLLFIKPGQNHDLSDTTGLAGCMISFTDSFFELEISQTDISSYKTLFQLLDHTESGALPANLLHELQEIIDRMQAEYQNDQLFSEEILQRYLKIFLLCLVRHFKDHFHVINQTRNMQLVQNFLSLLDKRFKTQKMVAAYARELYVSPNYLNEIIKKNTGFPAGYHIRQRVVLEARRLAQYSNMCMKEIAYSLDFADSAHFSKFFKTVTGTNFSDLKRKTHAVIFKLMLYSNQKI